jgi:hypothetical protein
MVAKHSPKEATIARAMLPQVPNNSRELSRNTAHITSKTATGTETRRKVAANDKGAPTTVAAQPTAIQRTVAVMAAAMTAPTHRNHDFRGRPNAGGINRNITMLRPSKIPACARQKISSVMLASVLISRRQS